MQPLNPSEMVYIGGTNHEAVAYLAAAGRSAPEEGAIFAYGGGGVVISAALMHQLTLDMLSCMAAQRSSIGGDDRIGHCVQRIGGKLTIHPGTCLATVGACILVGRPMYGISALQYLTKTIFSIVNSSINAGIMPTSTAVHSCL